MTDAERRAAVDLVAAELGMSAAGVEALVRLIASPVPSVTAQRELVDAAEVARRFGRSRGWVYDNAGALGAVRLGDGPRPRLAFDPDRVAAYIAQQLEEAPATPTTVSQPRRRRRREEQSTSGVPLLPIGPAGRTVDPVHANH